MSDEDSSEHEPLARTVMCFMDRGLLPVCMEFPYAYFPSKDLTGDLLYEPFWEAVKRLDRLGLKVCIL